MTNMDQFSIYPSCFVVAVVYSVLLMLLFVLFLGK